MLLNKLDSQRVVEQFTLIRFDSRYDHTDQISHDQEDEERDAHQYESKKNGRDHINGH